MSYYVRQQHEGVDKVKILGVKMHNRTGDLSDFEYFYLKEVNYVDLWESEIPSYHTSHGSYLALSTVKDLTAAYAGYGFESYDRSNVVNVDRIKELQRVKRGTKVIFQDGSYVIVRKNI